jgi:hypothetical protein
MLLARGGRCDSIDATVVCLAVGVDDMLTSGPGGLRVLVEAAVSTSASSRSVLCQSRLRCPDSAMAAVTAWPGGGIFGD